MAVVYRHIRKDKNEPFYIGIGKSEDRAYSIKSRNRYWKSIVAVTDYEVEVLFEGLSWEEAQKKEQEFIALHGRKDLGLGPLVNMTDGGDGALGRPQTLQLKQKLKNSPNRFSLAKWQKEHGAAVKGKTLPTPSQEVIEKRRQGFLKYWKEVTAEEKEKRTTNFRETNPSYKKFKCNNCQKEIQGASAFKRFHGDNCKSKQQ